MQVMMMIKYWILGKNPRGQKYFKAGSFAPQPGAYDQEETTWRNQLLLEKDLNQKYLKVE